MNATFTSPGINCGGCARNVKAALARTPGVSNVEVDVPAKRVAITFDDAQTSPEQLADALTEAGYPPAPAAARA